MTHPITVTIAPEPSRVRVLATQSGQDILKAVLGPAATTHPRAAATLLEGLALWYHQPLSVVLCVDGSDDSSALDLYDGLGLGRRELHYEVGIAASVRRPRRRPVAGLGDFRELRQMSLGSEWLR